MTRIDARGLRCPWPALRLGRALRQGVAPPIELLADDPNAPVEIGALAEGAGLVAEMPEPGRFLLVAQRD